MPGLVDKWTSELAKLRNKKDRTIFEAGSSPTTPESSQMVQAQEKSATNFASVMPKLNLPLFTCSEASVSMLVECFSP
ncbi:hypothetical protein LOK49_LG02G03559 [Camellia lanceoleosa]|uniref:Uncharacterized protein n=1 Tax=Camellia lanceoleosa TaxID=1840588 RepID=A0ACC0IRA2_9ERIC|nr:hypothetical protein LOK49_LG02G03559 [Camellia lanceoleosa]